MQEKTEGTLVVGIIIPLLALQTRLRPTASRVALTGTMHDTLNTYDMHACCQVMLYRLHRPPIAAHHAVHGHPHIRLW